MWETEALKKERDEDSRTFTSLKEKKAETVMRFKGNNLMKQL